MKTPKPNPTFALAETFFSIASSLSNEQSLYLARHKDLLEKWLKKIKTNLVSDQISETPIPAKPEVSINKVLYSPERFDRSIEGNSIFNPLCLATKEGSAYEYKLTTNLFPDELVEYMGGESSLQSSLFGLQQIRLLAIKQNLKKSEGVLSSNCSNYFPVLDKNKNVRFLSIYWARYKTPNRLIGSHCWEFCTAKKDKFMHEGAKLFLFQTKES